VTRTDPTSRPILAVLALALALALTTAPAGAGAPAAGARPAPPASSALATPPDEVDRLLVEIAGNHDAQTRATAALVKLAPAVIPRLVAGLTDPRWVFRWRMVNVLGYIKDPAAIGPLVQRILVDVEPHVRWRSLWALGTCDPGGARGRELLAKELANPDPVVQWNAAVGLSFFKDRRALPYLHEGLAKQKEFKLFEAVFGLENVHDERTSGLLEPVLTGDGPANAKREAVLLLRRICDEKSWEILARTLAHDDPQLRWRAAAGLGDCGGGKSRAPLAARREIEKDTTVLDSIDKALAKVPPASP
jgi:HEAT repeat protein